MYPLDLRTLVLVWQTPVLLEFFSILENWRNSLQHTEKFLLKYLIFIQGYKGTIRSSDYLLGSPCQERPRTWLPVQWTVPTPWLISIVLQLKNEVPLSHHYKYHNFPPLLNFYYTLNPQPFRSRFCQIYICNLHFESKVHDHHFKRS